MCSMKKEVALIFGEEARLILPSAYICSQGVYFTPKEAWRFGLKIIFSHLCDANAYIVHEQSYYLYFSDRLPFGQLYLMSFSASTSLASAHKFQRFFGDSRSTTPKCWFLLNRTLVLTVCNHYTSYQILLCYSFSEMHFVANSVTATAVLLQVLGTFRF